MVSVPPHDTEQYSNGRFVGNVKYDVLSRFPAVEPDDWCGEYQPEREMFRRHMKETW